MFRGFSRAVRSVPRDVRNSPFPRNGAIAGQLDVTEAHEEWVKTDVVDDGGDWMARFSDITSVELEQAASSIGLPHGGGPLLEDDQDSRYIEVGVEDIDADAQMRQLQSQETNQLSRQNPYASVTQLALQMAQRPRIQAALMEEIRADAELRTSLEEMSRQHGVELRLMPFSPSLLGAAEQADTVKGAPNPFEGLLTSLLEATKQAGAAIGAYVQRVVSHIMSLTRILQGKRANAKCAEGAVFDDEAAVSVNRAQVMLDMTVALASLLIIVAILGRAGARVLARA